MKTNHEYVIPVGTEINTRNVTAELRLRKHVTKKELRFNNLTNTGDGGLVYYFDHGDWLIAVNSDHVQLAQSERSLDASLDASIAANVVFPKIDNTTSAAFMSHDGHPSSSSRVMGMTLDKTA